MLGTVNLAPSKYLTADVVPPEATVEGKFCPVVFYNDDGTASYRARVALVTATLRP